MTLPAVDAATFKRGMRHLAAAVTVITAEHAGECRGLTATAVCSVSADPPTLLACVNRESSAHPWIDAGSRFCVNVLAAEHMALSRTFGGAGSVAERFARAQWTRLATGAPALVGALAAFDCIVERRIEAGTHTVFFGRVVAVEITPDREPLLYADGGYVGIAPITSEAPSAANAATTAVLVTSSFDEFPAESGQVPDEGSWA